MKSESDCFNRAYAYKAFDLDVQSIEIDVKEKAPFFLGYDKSQLSERLVQRVVELSLDDYVFDYSARFQKGESVRGIKIGRYACREGRLSNLNKLFSFKSLIRSLLEFYAYWLMIFIAGFKSVINIGSRKSKVSLLYGVGKDNFESGDSERAFYRYCKQGPIKPLLEADCVIVQGVKKDYDSSQGFYYDRFPLVKSLVLANINLNDLFRFVFFHCLVFAKFHLVILRFPFLAVIGKDFACHAAVDLLNRKNILSSVVFTNSNYTAQPLWSYCFPKSKFDSHMVWYSMNVIPMKYKRDMLDWPMPNYRHVKVKTHWIWTEFYKNYFDEIGMVGEKEVVPPVLWYLTDQGEKGNFPVDSINLVVFDVTPIDPVYIDEMGLAGVYYDYNTMSKFILDIVEVAKEISSANDKKVRVFLKSKREFHRIHDKKYIELLSSLEKAGEIFIIPHSDNLFRLVSETDMSITIPYSSPPLISSFCSRPAVYYDPTSELEPYFAEDDFISFVSSDVDLLKAIQSNIG